MADTLKKVKTGDPLKISAATFNTFVDAARDYLQRQHGTGGNPTQAVQQAGAVLVKNASGGDRDRFDVLGIDAPIFTPTDNLEGFKNTIALKGVVPTGDHAGAFVVLMEPLAINAIGRAVVSGVTVVKVNVTDADHRYAEAKAGESGYLESAGSGSVIILWKESGTGQKWAVVRIGGSPSSSTSTESFPAKLSASLGSGQYTGKEQVWNGTTFSDKPGASNITIKNVAETGYSTSPILVTGSPIVMVIKHGDYYLCDRPTNAAYRA